MKRAYVTSLVESILTGTPVEVALERTLAALKSRGHGRLWAQILTASLRELESKLASQAAQVTVAREADLSTEALKAALVSLGADGATHRTVVDETLIGGFTARFKDKLIDSSYKRALLNMYRQITK